MTEFSIDKFLHAIKLGKSDYYNLACGYALLKNKEKALKYLEIALKNEEISVDYVLDDTDWECFLDDNEQQRLRHL